VAVVVVLYLVRQTHVPFFIGLVVHQVQVEVVQVVDMVNP
jgi:hypothetical protein